MAPIMNELIEDTNTASQLMFEKSIGALSVGCLTGTRPVLTTVYRGVV